jgi:hypothetical protein
LQRRGYPSLVKGAGFRVRCETSRKTHKKAKNTLKEQSCEDRRARSKAMDLGSIPVGVRRFESGSSHSVLNLEFIYGRGYHILREERIHHGLPILSLLDILL